MAHRVLPGFGLSLGITLAWLSLIVLIPLAGLAIKTSELTWARFWSVIADDRTVAALQLSFSAALAAAVINAFAGTIIAWGLVRYRFPGRRILDAIIDLPFALPTAVAGIALTALYAPNGWIGSMLAPLGITVAFTWLGVTVALVFIGLPFVVRTIQPVLEEIPREIGRASCRERV